jgi:PAS domain S-box-containing protein
MTSIDGTDLRRGLQTRQAEIADHWYRAVAHTSFAARSAADVRQSFESLTAETIDLLFAEPFNGQHAQTIGATLARLTYAYPEALGQTQTILTHQLLAGVPSPHRLALHERLALLLSDVATGFAHAVRTTVLAEQEQTRTALIEQQRWVEATLRESEHRLRIVLTHVPVVLFALDCSGVITLARGKGLTILGLTPEAVIGRSILDLTNITPHIVENIHRALAGDAFTDIVELGAWVFETRYAPLRDEQDQVVGMIGVAVDISERRQLQRELEAMRRHYTPIATPLLPDHDLAVTLTCREWDVIHLITAGKTNREIALALSISTKTVEKHINSMYAKLGIHSRVDMTTWALHHTARIPPERRQG